MNCKLVNCDKLDIQPLDLFDKETKCNPRAGSRTCDMKFLLNLIDACYCIQDSSMIGRSSGNNFASYNARNLISTYLNKFNYGEYWCRLASIITISFNDFYSLFHSYILKELNHIELTIPMFEYVETEEFKKIFEDYREEYIVPLFDQVVMSLNLETRV